MGLWSNDHRYVMLFFLLFFSILFFFSKGSVTVPIVLALGIAIAKHGRAPKKTSPGAPAAPAAAAPKKEVNIELEQRKEARRERKSNEEAEDHKLRQREEGDGEQDEEGGEEEDPLSDAETQISRVLEEGVSPAENREDIDEDFIGCGIVTLASVVPVFMVQV